MSSFSTFAAALITELSGATGFEAFDFENGPAPDVLPPTSVAIGYVWVTLVEPDQDNQLVETLTAMVRLYPIQVENPDPGTPIDPTPIYDAAQALQTALAPDFAGPAGGDPWWMKVASVELNHADQAVDAVIEGTRWNDASVS